MVSKKFDNLCVQNIQNITNNNLGKIGKPDKE